jgi:hypothetical protein
MVCQSDATLCVMGMVGARELRQHFDLATALTLKLEDLGLVTHEDWLDDPTLAGD